MENDRYDYLSAGFDGFLSRSIDGITQFNLNSPGPISTQVRFDSAQTSGAIGDIVRVGQRVVIDGINGSLTFLDDQGNAIGILEP